MMKIIKPQSLGILHKPYGFLGQHYLAIAALGFFRLGAENPRFMTENLQWPHVLASLPAGQALDEVMPKVNAEVLLAGSAYSPQQKPCTQLNVQMCVEDSMGRPAIVKSLCVTGDRDWRSGFMARSQVSKPKPFTTMPLVYSRAFGGAGYALNPVGCGRCGLLSSGTGAMPNISYPATPGAITWNQSVAAGFGPISIGNVARKRKLGTYNRTWLQQDAPGFARDIDWSAFNLAPPDQWAKQLFKGGENYCLQNLHPHKALLEGRLPALQARAFMLQNNQAPAEASEVSLQMDTVWFFPDHDLGVVIYHGQAMIEDSDALDVGVLMIGYESVHSPRPVSHYREVMGLRMDKATAIQHVYNDSQLAAEHSPQEVARRARAQADTERAALEKSQKRLDLLDAQYWAKRGVKPPAGHQPARATLPVLGIMTEEVAKEGDFDLSDTLAKARALAADAKAQGEKALAAIVQSSKPSVDPQKQLGNAIERASLPAYDLEGRVGDPQVMHALASVERKQAEGVYTKPGEYERARQAVIKLPSVRRQGRRAAVSVVLPELPLLPTVASEFGMQVRQWLQQGICLAGRDLAGADLAGCDFTGADLREVMLEGANLAGAIFCGANLQGAVLTGACLDGADFSSANLYQANLSTSSGRSISFYNANLGYVHALDADWPGANLQGANLQRLLGIRLKISGANLDRACINKATLMELVANNTRWQGANLEKAVFVRADLQGADFSGANLVKTLLNEAGLQDSCWAMASLDSVQSRTGSNWSRANFAAAKLQQCGFHGADFSHTDFRKATVMRCDFGSSNLHSACLDDALFAYSLFFRASLSETSAQRTEFFQATCRKADFTNADLATATFAQSSLNEAIGYGDTARRNT